MQDFIEVSRNGTVNISKKGKIALLDIHSS
jgi:hypothetical protein